MKAYDYARWCVEETEGKVPRYVKLQAQQWLEIADGKDPEAYVDETIFRLRLPLSRLGHSSELDGSRCSIGSCREERDMEITGANDHVRVAAVSASGDAWNKFKDELPQLLEMIAGLEAQKE